MKRLTIFVVMACIWLASCNNSQSTQTATEKQADTHTTVEFDNKNYSFGTVVKGEIVEHTYFFTNTGNVDLVIKDVNPSCGCTTPDWTKEPVKPGEKGKLRVKFDTKHQSLGNKTKQVAVYTNTKPSRTILQFSAQVIAPQ